MYVSKLFKYWTAQFLSPGNRVREKYEAFQRLLDRDRRCHELLAELEEIYYQDQRVDIAQVEARYDELAGAVAELVESLLVMAPGRYENLKAYFRRIDSLIRYVLAPPLLPAGPPFTKRLAEISLADVGLVGGKAANLAVVANRLQLPVPAGFVITTNSFNAVLAHNRLRPEIDQRLAGLDVRDTGQLEKVAEELTALLRKARLPAEVATEIVDVCRREVPVGRLALRSSAVSEDSHHSFAGQYRTVLGVDRDGLLAGYQQVLASKYAARALYYRIQNGYGDRETPMAVLAVEMLDAQVSGVMATTDPETGDPDLLSIHAIWGLGEPLVAGDLSPDILKVDKSGPAVVSSRPGDQQSRLALSAQGVVQRPLAGEQRRRLCLAPDQALVLADWGIRLERFYGCPQEVEWCLTGEGRLYLLQSRPLPGHRPAVAAESLPEIRLPVLLAGGDCAVTGIGSGRVFRMEPGKRLEEVEPGTVLVTGQTPPSYVQIMDRLVAVVADRASVTGHFASVAREFGVPTLVNTGRATELLTTGQEVTVDAGRRQVYQGIVPGLPARTGTGRSRPDTPFHRKLGFLIKFLSPLNLVDPKSPDFVPEGCRSLHDIIRFVHEKGMAEMFAIGQRGEARKRGSRRLRSEIPLTVYLLDVGGGLEADTHQEEVTLDQVRCLPLQAVWKGLCHPGIRWEHRHHFDWQTFDSVALAGGVARRDVGALASYAVVGREYLNFNLRFGYHFTILDTFCGEIPDNNYILLRFAGGGGNFHGRALRVLFLVEILTGLGFTVETRGDLLDAGFGREERSLMLEKLEMLGRLLGATKLMDMVLKDEEMVHRLVAEFFAGRYHFGGDAGRSGKEE